MFIAPFTLKFSYFKHSECITHDIFCQFLRFIEYSEKGKKKIIPGLEVRKDLMAEGVFDMNP